MSVEKMIKKRVYGVKNKNSSIRKRSQSGGAFVAISDYVLSMQGVVYGCKMGGGGRFVYHAQARNYAERDDMCKSKYIQSEIRNTFMEAKKDLDDGTLVLFTGTPCQIAGLKCFLGREYENLVCVDLVCHGVPSPLVWDEYLNWQERENNDKVCDVLFRNKIKFPWGKHIETLRFISGRVIDSKIFKHLFYGHNIVRPSCFCCHFRSLERVGDITIGDFWGVEKIDRDFKDNDGVSLFLVNSVKGEKIFESCKEKMDCLAIEDGDLRYYQLGLNGELSMPEERKEFWRDFKKGGFEYIVKKYVREKGNDYVRRKITSLINKLR